MFEMSKVYKNGFGDTRIKKSEFVAKTPLLVSKYLNMLLDTCILSILVSYMLCTSVLVS